MPSSINNCMRAMMGSLRRWYDKVLDGTLALPYLPLAGGTVTGNVAINGTGGVSLSGVQLRNISSGLEVYNAGGGSVASRGPYSGYTYGDRNLSSADWEWYATGGTSYLLNTGAGNVLTVSATGNLSAAAYYLSGVALAERDTTNKQIAIFDYDGIDPALVLGGAVGGYGSYYRAETHTLQSNNGGATFATINAAGVTVAGTVTAGAITSTSTINATGGTITGQQLTSTGNINAAGTVTGVAINANGNLGVAGSGTISNNLTVAGSVTAAIFYGPHGLVLLDVIADLQARVAALEGAP